MMEYTQDDELTRAFRKNFVSRRRVLLQVKDGRKLLKVEEHLTKNSLLLQKQKWVDDGNVLYTCIGIKPYYKEFIYPFVKHLEVWEEGMAAEDNTECVQKTDVVPSMRPTVGQW